MTLSSSLDHHHARLAALMAVGLGLLVLSALTGLDVHPRGPIEQPGSTPIGVEEPTNQPGRATTSETAVIALSRTDRPTDAKPWTVLRGVVRDRDGRLIHGAAIELRGLGDADHETHSGSDGAFVVERLVPGSYQVLARGPGFLTCSGFLDVDAGAGECSLEVVVDAGSPLSGEVVDGLGQPVAGARITPWRRGASDDELDPRTAVTTNAGGQFELRGRSTGLTYVLVEHDGFAPKRVCMDPRRTAHVRLEPEHANTGLPRQRKIASTGEHDGSRMRRIGAVQPAVQNRDDAQHRSRQELDRSRGLDPGSSDAGGSREPNDRVVVVGRLAPAPSPHANQ